MWMYPLWRIHPNVRCIYQSSSVEIDRGGGERPHRVTKRIEDQNHYIAINVVEIQASSNGRCRAVVIISPQNECFGELGEGLYPNLSLGFLPVGRAV